MKTVKQRSERHAIHLSNGILLCVEAYVPTIRSSNRVGAREVGFRNYAEARLYLPENGRADSHGLCSIRSNDAADDVQTLIGDVLMQLGVSVGASHVVKVVNGALASVLSNPSQE